VPRSEHRERAVARAHSVWQVRGSGDPGPVAPLRRRCQAERTTGDQRALPRAAIVFTSRGAGGLPRRDRARGRGRPRRAPSRATWWDTRRRPRSSRATPRRGVRSFEVGPSPADAGRLRRQLVLPPQVPEALRCRRDVATRDDTTVLRLGHEHAPLAVHAQTHVRFHWAALRLPPPPRPRRGGHVRRGRPQLAAPALKTRHSIGVSA